MPKVQARLEHRLVSACVGIDLSTRFIDLVKLDEDSNRAEWVRCELAGQNAWERTLGIQDAMFRMNVHGDVRDSWWDDVYLVAIETPVNDQRRVLSRVQGAILASLPARLRQPHCCWDVHPSTWKAGLGLKGKPTVADIDRLIDGVWWMDASHQPKRSETDVLQNGRDAYCIAMFARDTNAKAVALALGETA